MTAASFELCSSWATPEDVPGPDCQAGCTEDPDLMDDCLSGASLILYNLTGRRWPGVCTDVIRPTAEHTAGLTSGWWPFDGYAGPWNGDRGYDLYPGMWGYCSCNGVEVCGAHFVSEIRLPGWPVDSVTEVKIDGAVIPADRYRIQDRGRLVWVPHTGDVRQGFPCCQRVELPTTETDTWSVMYTWGTLPPRIAIRYAGILACELYRSFKPGTDTCRLPRRITSITRQGVTIAVLDSFDVFEKGLTGLPEIDLWVTSLRAGSKAVRPEVWTPATLSGFRRDQP